MVARLFAYLFCLIAAAFVVGRSLGATLFLSRVAPSALPYTYVLSAVGVSAVAAVYVKWAPAPTPAAVITALVFSLTALFFRALLEVRGDAIILMAALYVFFDVVGDLGLLQFWTLAQGAFSTQQAKRFFPLIGAGGTIAGIVGGGLLSLTVSKLGASNLLFVVAGLLLACGLIARKIKLTSPKRTNRTGLRRSFSQTGRSPYLRAIAAMVVATTIVTILVDYQWKVEAQKTFGGDEERLASYFGLFFMVTSGIALFFQTVITPWLLERFGIRVALLLLPCALGCALLSVSMGAGFWGITLAKGFDSALRYSVSEPTFQLLYRSVSSSLRTAAKGLIDGIARPSTAAATGLLIAIWVGPAWLGSFALSLVVLWLILVVLIKQRYVDSLSKSLGRHQSLGLRLDASTVEVLEAALMSEDQVRAHHALSLISEYPNRRWNRSIGRLLFKGRALRLAALNHLAEHGIKDIDRVAETITQLLDDDEPQVRALSIACVVRFGDLSGLLVAVHKLERMRVHPNAKFRVAAAVALEKIAEERFYEPLQQLLADEVVEVRLAAARAAERAPNPALIPALLDALLHPRVQPRALAALAKIGPEAVPYLATLLNDPRTDLSLASAIPIVVGSIQGDAAYALVFDAIEDFRPQVRRAAILGLKRKSVRLESSLIDGLIQREVSRCEAVIQTQTALCTVHNSLLEEALSLRIERSSDCVVGLLSLRYPVLEWGSVHSALMGVDHDLSANAIELLDNAVELTMRSRILALFDNGGRSQDLGSSQARQAALRTLLEDWSAWMVSCALFEIGSSGERSLRAQVKVACMHKDKLVQDTAKRVMEQLEEVYDFDHRASALFEEHRHL